MQIEYNDTTSFLEFLEKCLPDGYRLRYYQSGTSTTPIIEKKYPARFFPSIFSRYRLIARYIFISWTGFDKAIFVSDREWEESKETLSPIFTKYEELTGEKVSVWVNYDQYNECND